MTTDSSVPTRNEAAERLREGKGRGIDGGPTWTVWGALNDYQVELDAALAHERQQGREEAVPADIRERHGGKRWEACNDWDHVQDLHAILDAIASPSEEPKE